MAPWLHEQIVAFTNDALRDVDEEIDEAQRLALVREIVGALVYVAGPRVWNLGNGRGGWLLDEIARVAAMRGLPAIDGGYRPPDRVQMLAERDGWWCHYCGGLLAGGPTVPTPTIDHVIPRARGGDDRLDNLVLACGACNSSKGARPADEFMRGAGQS